MISANYPGSNPVADRAARVSGVANQIGYFGGIAGQGAKLLAEYIVDLHDSIEDLKSQVAELMAKEAARVFEHNSQHASSSNRPSVQRQPSRT